MGFNAWKESKMHENMVKEEKEDSCQVLDKLSNSQAHLWLFFNQGEGISI